MLKLLILLQALQILGFGLGLQLEGLGQCKASSTTSLPESDKILSQHAPSVITCTFLCNNDPECKHYIFADNLCSLYRSTSEVASNSPSSKLICHQTNRVQASSPVPATVQQIVTAVPKVTTSATAAQCNKPTFVCLPMASEQTCVCINPLTLDWNSASIACQRNGMTLTSVLTEAKHSQINNVLINYSLTARDTPRFWTSGKRLNKNQILSNDYGWMNGSVMITAVNTSFWEPDKPDRDSDQNACIEYEESSKSNLWRWTLWDNSCTSNYKSLCEFTY